MSLAWSPLRRLAPRMVMVTVMILVLVAVSFSGCVFTPEDPMEPGPMRGYEEFDVRVKAMGRPPEDVSAVVFSFQRIGFYEQTSGGWFQIMAPGETSIDLNRSEAAHVATATLPQGSYSMLWGTLGSLMVREGDEYRSAVPLAHKCQIPVSMVLDGDDAVRPVLTLYVFLEDAIWKQNNTWFAQPAFSGSHFIRPDGDGGEEEGDPRYGRPRCDDSS